MANDRVLVSRAKITRVGDAIREKLGEATLYTLDDMPDAIRRIGGEPPVPPTPTGTTYTILIDTTKSPNEWGTWEDDAVNLEECPVGYGENGVDDFMGYYVCSMINGQEIDRIDPDNYQKTIGGENVLDTQDVMVFFPNRGYKISKPDSTHIRVSITSAENQEGYTYQHWNNDDTPLDGFYLGAYEASGEAHSRSEYIGSGVTLKNYDYGNSDWINGWVRSNHNDDTNYTGILWSQLIYLQCCALIKYKGKPLRSVLGRGYADSSLSFPATPGDGDIYGLNHGDVSTYGVVKLFGIENFYGSLATMLSGVEVTASNHFRISKKLNQSGNCIFEDMGLMPFESFSGNIKNIADGSKFGFISDGESGGSFAYQYFNKVDYPEYGIGFGEAFPWGASGEIFRMAQYGSSSYFAQWGYRIAYNKQKEE